MGPLEKAVVGHPNLPMTHGSLFSGIGGFDLAAEWMGWSNVFNCEWEEFPRRVLKHHFPHATQHQDIREFDATAYAGRVDIVSGGFPCQPYSTAGKRKGKDDERHLWPEMLRVVRECAPRYVVGENVRGLVSWNGGLVFEEVCVDLEALGYAVQPFLLPACGVGAPHRRDRVWFVAYSDKHANLRRPGKDASTDEGQGLQQGVQIQQPGQSGRVRLASDSGSFGPRTKIQDEAKPRGNQQKDGLPLGNDRNASNSEDVRLEHPKESGKMGRILKENRCHPQAVETATWERFPTVPPVCGGDDGLPKELDGITFSKWRRESIKAYGNAIVPQVALQIFKAIQAHENGT